MICKLTLNGVTVEYPSDGLMVTIRGAVITFTPITPTAQAPVVATAQAPVVAPATQASEPETLTHLTKRGKLLHGVVRFDLDLAGARALDPLAFRKNGGWFIRTSPAPSEIAPQVPKAAEPPVILEHKQQRSQMLPSNWKNIVFATLRETGPAYVRTLSSQVFGDAMTPAQSSLLRYHLRMMIRNGELVAISNNGRHTLFGLPTAEKPS